MYYINLARKIKSIMFFLLFACVILLCVVFSEKYLPSNVIDFRNEAIRIYYEKGYTMSDFPVVFESYYNSFWSRQPWSLDVFSFVHKVLGKREARGFEVLRSNNGALYLKGDERYLNTDLLQMISDEYKILFDETNQCDGHFLYVRAPFKNVGQAPDLADYSLDATEESEKYLCKLLEEKGIPVLDLGNYNGCLKYYNTDHHWTVESAFNAAAIIVRELEQLYGFNITGQEYYGNMKNYTPITYKSCFLGSIGIKVGKYFGGLDDFVVYKPKFKTNLKCISCDGRKSLMISGGFWETFINQELLEDLTYYNKYIALMHGAFKGVVVNNYMATNSYKGLIISHSYARAMVPYMSLNYREMRFLDPQDGRYNGNLVKYIRKYKPDIVVVMYNGRVNVGDGN